MRYYERNCWKQKSHQCSSSQFLSWWKTEKTFNKKEIAETFNSYLLNIDPNLTASIPESKTTFQNYIPNNGPYLSQYHHSYDLELGNAFASLKTNERSGYDDISADFVKKSVEIFVILKHISLAMGVSPDKPKITR